ncbi:putative dehydrogenase [Microbacterium terrae]|uniref:1,5-anhydro-D-fructose reductase n=1 Tax=Microbacterium terrae TaxID=69369 RepID=A0A0M2HHI3_9MICO|nr:Gfo/Idh/MocA family oxidoreductase [Microbacterium terrae]KJL44238.1 1,5-anhydro-D-fructose reductase [Microbacterium terrae]MBP1078778.1 putative dehydrogenase [Microbacterium terrae]GLJ98179.1 hypothetical protein GCM10017594_13760 [Microbacterium terrae]
MTTDAAGTNPLRIGVVGAGGNTRLHHIPKLQAIAGVEVVAVANRSAASARAVAEEFGIPRIAEHWTDVTSAPDVDAVVVGTWPDHHARVSIAALEAGKHVLCEARLARDVAEARAMVAAADARPDLVAQVVPAPFTLALDATVRRLIDDGFLGDLVSIEVVERGGFADRAAARTWRQTTEFSGVNIMSLGIWYEAVLRWVGPADRVTALGATTVPQRPAAGGGVEVVDVPDHLDVLAALTGGAHLSMHLSQATGLGPQNAVHLFGTDGTLRIADGVLSGGRRGDAALAAIDVPPAEAIGWRVEQEFVGAIRGNERIRRTTFADGLAYMTFTEAVGRSIRDRRTVTLDEL